MSSSQKNRKILKEVLRMQTICQFAPEVRPNVTKTAAMKITCAQCSHSYEVESRKNPVELPPGLRVEPLGTRLRMSWWRHTLPFDLRWLGLVLIVVVLAVAANFVPSSRTLQEGEPIVWAWLLAVLSAVAFVVLRLLSTFFQRRVVEVDSLFVRAWTEPFGLGKVNISTRSVRQFHVSPGGELRCETTVRSQQALTSGSPLTLRYVEQQLESRLNIEDIEVAGEWRPGDWIRPEWRVCPQCAHEAPAAEVVRQLEPVAKPDKIHCSSSAGRLEMRWSWRDPSMAFLAVWLLIWDGVCSVFVAAGLAQVAKGHLAGLGVFLIPHVWIGIIMTYYFLTMLMNQTTWICDKNTLQVNSGPLPWPGATKTYNCRDFEQLFVLARRHKNSTTYLLQATMKGASDVTLAKSSDKKRMDYLEQELEKFLGIVNR